MIRPDILQALEDYVAGKHPYPFGGFLTALLADDPSAYGRADSDNQASFHELTRWVRNNVPMHMRGSYDAVHKEVSRQLDEYRKAHP